MNANTEHKQRLEHKRLLTTKRAAKLASVTTMTISLWEKSGLLPSVWIIPRNGSRPKRLYRRKNVLAAASSIVCSCGMLVKLSKMVKHSTTVFHRNYSEIRKLLRAGDLTFAEIGKTFGVTKETIRQLAPVCGVCPETRRRTRMLKRMKNLERLACR